MQRLLSFDASTSNRGEGDAFDAKSGPKIRIRDPRLNTSEAKPKTTTNTSKRSAWHRYAITVSVVAHILLGLTLLFIYLPDPERNQLAGNAPTASGSKSQVSGTQEPKPLPSTPRPADLKSVPAEQIKDSIETQIDQANRLNDEEKLSELEKNLQRLESIASTESVQQVTTTVAETIGLDTETYAADKQAAEGAFDFDTAQLDDVIREPGKDGQWEYQSILVDSAGRKTTVPMGTGEGETLYSTFEQMKKYPFAQAIYRSVVMPLLQSLIASEKDKRASEPANQDEIEPTLNPGFGTGGGFGGGNM
ncbi:MAG: hypothetical protein ACPGLY_15695 [Rubripirellula sp.]